MNNNIQKGNREISLKNAAIIAGIGLLIMAIIAPIANFSIIQELIVYDDTSTTIDNIINSTGLFRTAIFLFLIVALLDIIIAWALYIFLKPINKYLSLLAAWLRVVYAAVLIMVLIYLINVLMLLDGPVYLSGLSTDQINTHVMILLDVFNKGWEFGLILFGFHLLLLGYLFLKAGYMKWILGILLILAALGYLIDGIGKLLSTDYNLTISMFTFIGEVILIFWLLIKGRTIKEII